MKHKCIDCDHSEDQVDFSIDNRTGRPQSRCKVCSATWCRNWRATRKQRVRDDDLNRRYGLLAGQYELMLKSQGGVCNICKKPPKDGKHLMVDHCHKTYRVRGLLCQLCNQILGYYGDDPAIFDRAIQHLRGLHRDT